MSGSIFLVPTSSRTQILVVKCLINPYCTGVVASQDFGKLLIDSGYDLLEDTVTTWNSSNGVFETSKKITLSLGMLPSLCKKRAFSMDINIMPNNNCSFPLVIGRSIMQNLKLDVNVLKNTFDWQDLTVPFAPRGHWTDSRIEQFCQVHFLQKEKAKKVTQDSSGLNSEDIYNTNIAKPVLKKVVYEPADLNKILAGLNYLTADKKPLLLNTLSKYPNVFEGERGDWKGEEVSIRLEPGSKPYYVQGYLIPISQREATKKMPIIHLAKRRSEMTIMKL